MAKAKAKAVGAEYRAIEQLQQEKNTPAAIFGGACAAQGWGKGKMVTGEEYDAAVAAFTAAPMGRSDA